MFCIRHLWVERLSLMSKLVIHRAIFFWVEGGRWVQLPDLPIRKTLCSGKLACKHLRWSQAGAVCGPEDSVALGPGKEPILRS